jgi:hypothetical protein
MTTLGELATHTYSHALDDLGRLFDTGPSRIAPTVSARAHIPTRQLPLGALCAALNPASINCRDQHFPRQLRLAPHELRLVQ